MQLYIVNVVKTVISIEVADVSGIHRYIHQHLLALYTKQAVWRQP